MTKQSDLDQIKDFLGSWKKRVFSGKLYYINTKSDGVQPFIPNKEQAYFYNNLHYYNVIPKARQLGFSTAIDILGLDFALFNSNVNVGVIADTLDNAKALFESKVRFPYENLGGLDKTTELHKLGCEIKKEIQVIEDNKSTMRFSNGSSIYVSTSFRSGTLQFLHVSEFGKISAKSPDKAKEIISGAKEALAEGGFMFIESTAEGKNDFHVIVKRAEKLHYLGKNLNWLEPKLFFFAWWENAAYRVDDPELEISEQTKQYFTNLKKDHDIIVTEAQAKWWQLKKEDLAELMGREYPSYLDEAFDFIVMGAYFRQQLLKLQEDRRYTHLQYDEAFPVYMASDLGIGKRDAFDVGFFQVIGKEIRLLRWWREYNTSFKSFHASVLVDLPYKLHTIFMPHDGNKRSRNDGKSTADFARELGYNVKVMRAMRFNDNIKQARDMFWRLWINVVDTRQKVMVGSKETELEIVDFLAMFKEKMDHKHNIPLGIEEHNDASNTGAMLRYLFQGVAEMDQSKLREMTASGSEAYSPDFDEWIG